MKFEHTEVWGFAHALRGMRNPMNSWAKSDSIISDGFEHIGKNDLQLMQRLIAAGSEHRKFMRQIFGFRPRNGGVVRLIVSSAMTK